MPIYAAFDHDGRVRSIVAAKTQEFAEVYWQGQEITPHRIENFSKKAVEVRDSEFCKVAPLVSTREIPNPNKLGEKIVVVDRR